MDAVLATVTLAPYAAAGLNQGCAVPAHRSAGVLRDPAFLLFFCTHSLSLTSSKSFGAQKGAAGASFGLLCVGEVPGGASRFVGDGPVLWAPAALILGPEPRCKQLTSARRPLLCFIDEFPRSAVYGLPQRPPQVGEHRPGPGPALCSRC